MKLVNKLSGTAKILQQRELAYSNWAHQCPYRTWQGTSWASKTGGMEEEEEQSEVKEEENQEKEEERHYEKSEGEGGRGGR